MNIVFRFKDRDAVTFEASGYLIGAIVALYGLASWEGNIWLGAEFDTHVPANSQISIEDRGGDVVILNVKEGSIWVASEPLDENYIELIKHAVRFGE